MYEEIVLKCPVCGSDYTHLESVEIYESKDNRKSARLHFYCEEGCKFIVDFMQHEGMTYITEKVKCEVPAEVFSKNI